MWSKLLITDGTKTGTIDLLPYYKEWLPSLAASKGGGYWSGSTYTQGRQLFDKQLDNIIDTFILNLFTGKQKDTIALINKLTTLLDKGVNYWINEWQTEMVWIEMCPEFQTESQFAIINDWSIPGLDEIFVPPFSFSGGMEDINLIIEHGLWLENEPGNGTAIELQSSNSNIVQTASDKSVWVTGYWDNSPLTHIFVYDAAPVTWTNITGLSGVNLFPAVPAAGDILYVGVEDTGTSSPFSNIVFNIGTAQAGLTIVAEYSLAAGWGAIPVAGYGYQDNTSKFQNTGRNVIVFDPISVGGAPWASLLINGVTAWWIRFRVTVAAAPVCPTQVTDAIYTQEAPYFDLDADEINGTYPALAKVKLLCQENSQGHPTAGFGYTTTDVLYGLRSLDRGDDFCAFLNASTVANALPPGVAFTRSTSALRTDLYAPYYYTTRWSTVVPVSDVFVGYWTISIPQSYEYEGTYRAFLRLSGSSSNTKYRISVSVGNVTSRPQQYSNWAWGSAAAAVRVSETLDLGIVEIKGPVSVRDNFSIIISLWITQSVGPGVADIYDLVLMPIDECSYQTSLPIGTGIVDALWTNKYLITDSITDPKISVSGELYGNPFLSSPFQGNWQVRSPNEIFWNAGKNQRMWILMMNEYNIASGGDGDFVSGFHLAEAVQAWKAQRYKALRGEE